MQIFLITELKMTELNTCLSGKGLMVMVSHGE